MRGNAQHDDCPPLHYRCQTVATVCENFRYHGNKGGLGARLNDTVKLPDLENP